MTRAHGPGVVLNTDFAAPLCPCWRQALLVAAASCPGLTQGTLAGDCHTALCRAAVGAACCTREVCVLCQALGTCKEGKEAGCILELGGEEEDGFPHVLLDDWHGVAQEGFGVFLTP